eukprot:COSAG06_NODE_22696_length_715_cov_1.634740_1_plen_163_part_10
MGLPSCEGLVCAPVPLTSTGVSPDCSGFGALVDRLSAPWRSASRCARHPTDTSPAPMSAGGIEARRSNASCLSATSLTFAIIGAMLSVTICYIIFMSCSCSFSTSLVAVCSGPNGPSLFPSFGGALAPRRATMLRSGCISRMATVPTNRTNARTEETVYTNRG